MGIQQSCQTPLLTLQKMEQSVYGSCVLNAISNTLRRKIEYPGTRTYTTVDKVRRSIRDAVYSSTENIS